MHLLYSSASIDDPFIWLVVGEGGLQAVLELVHLFLTQPRWEEAAMERAKQMYLSHYRSLPKSLERATADRIMAAMMGPDRCVLVPPRIQRTGRTSPSERTLPTGVWVLLQVMILSMHRLCVQAVSPALYGPHEVLLP